MTTADKPQLTREQYARIAAAASADLRTVVSYIAGLDIRPLVRERIEKALAELDMTDLVRKEA